LVVALPLVAAGWNSVAIGEASSKASVRVVVRGDGEIGASGRVCRSTCTWRVPAGTKTLRMVARPRAWSRFFRWSGACVGTRTSCTIGRASGRTVVGDFRSAATLPSWNTHVTCRAVLTTIETILGSDRSPLGGATEQGGGFQPHLAGEVNRRLLTPPCALGRVSTFVEVHSVTVAEPPEHSSDGDWVVNLTSSPGAANPMTTIHVEEDTVWIAAGAAPPLLPAMGTRIDVQGFVFWDPGHVTEAYHSFSGWELHALTAWRPAA
jgi:hypothetical protein